MEKNVLAQIQSTIKCPKNQFNKFGGFKYRSLEDILEASRQVLKDVNCGLLIDDDIVQVGERYYVKATAYLVDASGKTIASSTGFAREAESKKGMDEAQVTGASSSYARKYALNSLFCLDDSKDIDSEEPEKTAPAKPKKTEWVYDLALLDADKKVKAVEWCGNHALDVEHDGDKCLIRSTAEIKFLASVEVK